VAIDLTSSSESLPDTAMGVNVTVRCLAYIVDVLVEGHRTVCGDSQQQSSTRSSDVSVSQPNRPYLMLTSLFGTGANDNCFMFARVERQAVEREPLVNCIEAFIHHRQ
jgi:hypothetical protein